MKLIKANWINAKIVNNDPHFRSHAVSFNGENIDFKKEKYIFDNFYRNNREIFQYIDQTDKYDLKIEDLLNREKIDREKMNLFIQDLEFFNNNFSYYETNYRISKKHLFRLNAVHNYKIEKLGINFDLTRNIADNNNTPYCQKINGVEYILLWLFDNHDQFHATLFYNISKIVSKELLELIDFYYPNFNVLPEMYFANFILNLICNLTDMYEYKVTPNEFIGKWYYLFPLEDNSIYINLFSSNIFEDSDFKNIYKKGENLMIDLHKAEYNDKIVTYENIKESIEDGYFDKILKENIRNPKFCFNVV